MDTRKKLQILKGSLESGIIGQEQYEAGMKKIEPEISEADKKIQQFSKPEPEEPIKISSEKILVISIAVIILLLLAVIFAVKYFYKHEPKTLEEMHVLNLKGKLKPEQGYVYKGIYSFVNLDNEWFTQLSSPKGTRVYDLAMRYSPRELANITIKGSLNTEFFDNQSEYYVTFNPTGKDFSYVGVASADFNTHITTVFEKNGIAACDRNMTEPCHNRPIVTCEDSTKLVVYIKEAERFRAYYNNNCIVVEGNGMDLVRGVDRVLYNLYKIMGQQQE